MPKLTAQRVSLCVFESQILVFGQRTYWVSVIGFSVSGICIQASGFGLRISDPMPKMTTHRTILSPNSRPSFGITCILRWEFEGLKSTDRGSSVGL